MSLQMKDNHNAVWDAVNEFKSTTASVMSLYESDWQVWPENPQSLKTSCFPQMLLTDDSCWASSNPSRRKESSRFAPDRAHKGFRSKPANSVQALGSQRKPPGGAAQPKKLILSTITSPWHQPTLMQHFVNEDLVRALGACEYSLTADACLPASPTSPL